MGLTKFEKTLIDELSIMSTEADMWRDNYNEIKDEMMQLEGKYKMLEDKYNALLATTVPEEEF
jgi:predicted nuclease with TOPRIM domain